MAGAHFRFRYAFTLPAPGGNKLSRFQVWAAEHLPTLEYRLPPRVPIKTGTLTVRLRSPEDIARLNAAVPPGSAAGERSTNPSIQRCTLARLA